MAEVLIRQVYLAFAAASVAYSGRSMAPSLLQPTRDMHDVRHSKPCGVSICCYAIYEACCNATVYRPCNKQCIMADI